MGAEFPSNWQLVRLGDRVEVAIGGTPSRSNPRFWDTEKKANNYWVAISDLKKRVLWKTAEHISNDGVHNSNVKRVPTGTVLMSFKLSIGRVAITARPVYTNEAIAAFYPRSNDVAPEFLFYSLPKASLAVEADQAVKGRTLNKAKLLDLRLPLPPLPEQRKIAAILSSVDDTIEKTEAVIEQLEVVKKGLRENLLRGRLDSMSKKVSLASIAEIVRGSSPRPAGDSRYFNGSHIPWITVGEITKDDWPFLERTAMCLTEEGKRYSRILPKGTLLLTNSGATLGVPKITKIGACANDGVAALLNISSTVDQLFLYYALQGMTVTFRARASGVGQPNLNTAIIGEAELWLPPLERQKQAAQGLFLLDERILVEQSAMAACWQIKVALLDALLSGRVRVNTSTQEAA